MVVKKALQKGLVYLSGIRLITGFLWKNVKAIPMLKQP